MMVSSHLTSTIVWGIVIFFIIIAVIKLLHNFMKSFDVGGSPA